MNTRTARFFALVVAGTIGGLAAACDRGDRQAIEQRVDTAAARIAAGADTLGQRIRSRADTLGDRIAQRLRGREYSRAELAGLVQVANETEIEMGQMAQTRATDPQVREFAQRIVADHSALQTDVSAAMQRMNVTPQTPREAEDLRENHREAMRDLQQRPQGREFDAAFLDHEIHVHRRVIDEVEDALGRNPPQNVRTLLDRAQTGLRTHLAQAEELRRRL